MNANTCFFQQMFKVPVLFQHYMEHQENLGDNLHFIDFLSMHYGGQDMDDDDDDRDMQLPFKKVDYGAAQVVFVPVRTYSSPDSFTQCLSGIKINFKKNLHSNPHLGDLIKPPMA